MATCVEYSDCHSDVPTTNPENISQLWNEVMSKANKPPQQLAPGLDGGESVAPSGTTNKETDDESANPYDASFGEQVLPAYGMSYDNTTSTKGLLEFAYGDFYQLLNTNDEELNEQQRSIKTKIFSIFSLDWWQEQHDVRRIAEQYASMCELRVIEQEFKVYALSAIFGSQRLPFPLPRDENLMPFRLLEPAFGPKPLWEAPPLLGDEKKKYTWDNHPDCSFALSMQAFKHSVTPDVETCTVLFSNFAIYPYLSIEFKKTTTQTTKTAIHQLMVASTMALYNRYRLKCDVRKDKQWSAADYTQMRHYGIMFQASSWTLFCTVPEGLLCDKPKCTEPDSTPKSYDNNKLQSLSWTGCKMLMMDKGDCKVERGTRKLLYYLIQIHLWGMYTHGKSCKEDITEFIAFSRLDDYQGLEKLGRLKLTEGGTNGN